MPKFNDMRAGYRAMWDNATVRSRAAVKKVATGILDNEQRYREVEQRTGVPWFWIACVHHRESSGNFAGVLHNGQKIIGTGKRTTIVPKGRGPFSSWEEAAVDALTTGNHKLQTIGDWPVERMLYEFERYNGWGYLGKINSPYVWSFTSHQQPGKYVADGRFSKTAMDKQLGCAAILKMLVEMDADVGRAVVALPSDPPPPPRPKPDFPQPAQRGGIFVLLINILSRFFKR